MKCSFCGNELEYGTGKIYAKNTGSILYFCSKKCEKNLLKLNRNPAKTKWTKAFKKEEKGKGEKKAKK